MPWQKPRKTGPSPSTSEALDSKYGEAATESQVLGLKPEPKWPGFGLRSKARRFGAKSAMSGPRLPGIKELLGKYPKAPLILGAVVAILVLIVLGFASSYIAQPDFCKSCHEMEPAYEAWKESIHEEVDCNTCHYPGFVGFFKQKAALVSHIYYHFTKSYGQTGGSPTINADSSLSKAIDNNSCLKCHTPKRVITPRRTLVMNHNIHIEKGINCTTCHNRAGHPGSAGYKTFISMQGCFRCHGLSKSAIAPGRCTACHPKSFNIIPSSGELDHQTGTWLHGDHGKNALKDIGPCMMCHQKSFCTGCHGVEVPHPEKFKKENHGEIGTKNPEVCRKCHRQSDFCNSCHHKGYTGPPGSWIPMHQHVVNRVGPAYCFDCHGPTFCAKCHTTGQVQPKNGPAKNTLSQPSWQPDWDSGNVEIPKWQGQNLISPPTKPSDNPEDELPLEE
ncbi:MAG: NapC/NirT family cytochrome c [Firmicutes bacterium]|nr:NapC/NirT family cytochrome c [Bacillota bacterium]